jgi:thiamine-monophosphate kinase
VTTDMLVAGTHFFPDAEAESLGWKTLAVNLSDLAAMGAQPRWVLLAGALPEADEVWLAAFAAGFFACARQFAVDLVGGDTTRGPLNLCVTAIGEVPPDQALKRSGALPGDDLWVSGVPGRAALGLAHRQGRLVLPEPLAGTCLEALNRPQPRVELGLALRGLASAAIDVSDGTLADLRHILEMSGVGAEVGTDSLPSPGVGAESSAVRDAQLAGGDDYELVFASAATHRQEILALGARLSLPLTRFGRVIAAPAGTLNLIDARGQPVTVGHLGYAHFQ